MTWQDRKSKADVFNAQIAIELQKSLTLVRPASLLEDTTQATDMRLFSAGSLRIATRMRDLKYFANIQYRHEITVRSSTANGAGESEASKLSAGWCDFYFYGFGEFDCGVVLAYTVIDLRKLRLQMFTQDPCPVKLSKSGNESDGISFVAIDTRTTKGAIVKRWCDDSIRDDAAHLDRQMSLVR